MNGTISREGKKRCAPPSAKDKAEQLRRTAEWATLVAAREKERQHEGPKSGGNGGGHAKGGEEADHMTAIPWTSTLKRQARQAACEAVFTTYELVEAILANLSPFQLGTALKVCTTWRQIIVEAHSIPNVNVTLPEVQTARLPCYLQNTHVTYHPIIRDVTKDSTQESYASDSWVIRTTISYHGNLSWQSVHDTGTSEFLTYPPVQAVQIDFNHDWGSKHLLSDSNGVTVGDVLDLIISVTGRTGVPPANVSIRIREREAP